MGEPTYLSDHNLVETVLKCKIKRDTPKVKISNIRKAYDKFIWQSESSVLYKEALKDVDSQAKNVLEVQYDKGCINTAVNDFTSILAYEGMKVLKLKQHKGSKNLDQKIKYQWFDDECYILCRILRIKGRKIKIMSLHRRVCIILKRMPEVQKVT